MSIHCIEGDLTVDNGRFGIVVARFNAFIVERLLEGALDTLKRHGAREDRIEIVRVPGAFELPLAVGMLAQMNRHDGLIALGAVIRGETPHFDFVAGECIKGIGQAMLTHRVPIGLGVLTVDTIDQAIARAGAKAGNKGAEAALAVIEMVDVARQLKANLRPAAMAGASAGGS